MLISLNILNIQADYRTITIGVVHFVRNMEGSIIHTELSGSLLSERYTSINNEGRPLNEKVVHFSIPRFLYGYDK